jgi:hypothetical protein
MYICILLPKKEKIKFIFRNYFGNIVDIREGFFENEFPYRVVTHNRVVEPRQKFGGNQKLCFHPTGRSLRCAAYLPCVYVAHCRGQYIAVCRLCSLPPWPAGLPCAILARSMADTDSAVIWASLAHGRPAGHGSALFSDSVSTLGNCFV